jgi:hypothetical protein
LRVSRLFVAALTLVSLLAVAAGCGSSDEGAASTAAATGTGGSRTLGEGIENLQDAQAQLCPELVTLKADLTEVSATGTDAGQDVLDRVAALADTAKTAAASLNTAGAEDAATAAEDLSSSLESLSTSGGEDARALADEAAVKTQQLTDALQCP